MFLNLILAVVSILIPTDGEQAQLPSYGQAFAIAEAEHRPLLVIVSAKWCGPCQVLKRETILPMRQARALENAVVAIVDIDEQPELAEQLMRGENLPQIILFDKGRERKIWKRFSLIGMQSKERIAELLRKAVGR